MKEASKNEGKRTKGEGGGLFMTTRYICSWQYQSTSRGRWASKRLLMKFVSHLGKKLLLPGLLNWTQRTCRERMVSRVPDSLKSLRDILQDTEEND
ncbi:hypothetical protein LEMLEM_LOCUS6308 [Lemmus lemmus]